jgi:hypothetical protein
VDRSSNAFRPQLESLDGRFVPAIIGISQNITTGLAVVTADSGNDAINITDRGIGGLTVSGTGLAQAQTLDGRINRIVVNTGGGNDAVTYNITGTQRRSIRVEANLGAGNDRFTANQNGFDVRNSAAEVIRVTGGSGADRITVNAAGTAANRVNVAAGSSLQLHLVGGTDLDLFDGADVIAVDYQGVLSGDLRLREVGGLGGDNLRATVTLNGGSTGFVRGFGNARASLEGGFGADTIDFRVRDNSNGTANVSAEANAGLDLDPDVVRHTANVNSVFAFGDEDQVVV